MADLEQSIRILENSLESIGIPSGTKDGKADAALLAAVEAGRAQLLKMLGENTDQPYTRALGQKMVEKIREKLKDPDALPTLEAYARGEGATVKISGLPTPFNHGLLGVALMKQGFDKVLLAHMAGVVEIMKDPQKLVDAMNTVQPELEKIRAGHAPSGSAPPAGNPPRPPAQPRPELTGTQKQQAQDATQIIRTAFRNHEYDVPAAGPLDEPLYSAIQQKIDQWKALPGGKAPDNERVLQQTLDLQLRRLQSLGAIKLNSPAAPPPAPAAPTGRTGAPPPAAPSAPVNGPGGMTQAQATETAEKGLKIVADMLGGFKITVAQPGAPGGEFDAQSQTSAQEIFVKLNTLMQVPNPPPSYTSEAGKKLKDAIEASAHKAAIEEQLKPVGGTGKLFDALDTLHANKKLVPTGPVTPPPPPPIDMSKLLSPIQKRTLLSAYGENAAQARPLVEELLVLFTGGFGIQTLTGARVTALGRAGQAPLPPEEAEKLKTLFREAFAGNGDINSISEQLTDGVSAMGVLHIGSAERYQAYSALVRDALEKAKKTLKPDRSNLDEAAKIFADNFLPKQQTLNSAHGDPKPEQVPAREQQGFIYDPSVVKMKADGKFNIADVVEAYNAQNFGKMLFEHKALLYSVPDGDSDPANDKVFAAGVDKSTNIFTVIEIDRKALAADFAKQNFDTNTYEQNRAFMAEMKAKHTGYDFLMTNYGSTQFGGTAGVFMLDHMEKAPSFTVGRQLALDTQRERAAALPPPKEPLPAGPLRPTSYQVAVATGLIQPGDTTRYGVRGAVTGPMRPVSTETIRDWQRMQEAYTTREVQKFNLSAGIAVDRKRQFDKSTAYEVTYTDRAFVNPRIKEIETQMKGKRITDPGMVELNQEWERLKHGEYHKQADVTRSIEHLKDLWEQIPPAERKGVKITDERGLAILRNYVERERIDIRGDFERLATTPEESLTRIALNYPQFSQNKNQPDVLMLAWHILRTDKPNTLRGVFQARRGTEYTEPQAPGECDHCESVLIADSRAPAQRGPNGQPAPLPPGGACEENCETVEIGSGSVPPASAPRPPR